MTPAELDPRVTVVAETIWPWYAPGYVHHPSADVSTWHYLDRARAAVAALDALAAQRAETPTLLPAESIALTVALAQISRGEDPTPNVSAALVFALARLTGRTTT